VVGQALFLFTLVGGVIVNSRPQKMVVDETTRAEQLRQDSLLLRSWVNAEFERLVD
jgi:hypothetical protein